MPERRTVRHPISPVPECKKPFLLVRYRTKIMDAGMQMPVVSSMLMPSYSWNINFFFLLKIHMSLNECGTIRIRISIKTLPNPTMQISNDNRVKDNLHHVRQWQQIKRQLTSCTVMFSEINLSFYGKGATYIIHTYILCQPKLAWPFHINSTYKRT